MWAPHLRHSVALLLSLDRSQRCGTSACFQGSSTLVCWAGLVSCVRAVSPQGAPYHFLSDVGLSVIQVLWRSSGHGLHALPAAALLGPCPIK